MTDYNPENQSNEEGQVANVPGGEAGGTRISKTKLKEYGKQGLAPLLEVVQKYQGDLGPYLSAVSSALNAGAENLRKDSANDAEKSVGGIFSEAANWVEGAKGRLGSASPGEIYSFIEDEGRKHPGMLFSASYLAGIFLGRIGRHLGREVSSETISDQGGSTVH